MYNDKFEIVAKAIKHYGQDKQIAVAIEEMSELQKELCKVLRGDGVVVNYENIVEEVADVRLMLFEIQVILGIATEELDIMEDLKLKRLNERMVEDDFVRDQQRISKTDARGCGRGDRRDQRGCDSTDRRDADGVGRKGGEHWMFHKEP